MGAISSSSVNSVAASGNLVITAPASIVAGNLLVMICYNAGGGATVTPDTDWFLQIDSGVSNSSQAWVYTKTATISEPSTYTFNFDNSYNAMVCLQYPPLFIDSYIVNLDITDTLLTSAFSAYYSADQIVVGAGCGGGFTLATPTGLTFQDSTASYSNESLYAFDATALSTSIPSYSGLWSGTSAWTSIVFALSVTPPPSGASLTSDFSANGDADYTPPSYGSLTSDFFSSSVGTVTPPPPPPGQLSSLPTLSVQVAFSPTNLYDKPSLQTWTDVTQYVRDFNTRSGRQHFLDRIESASLDLTFNNRSGYFSSGSTILDTRMPIRITATWSGVTYPVYYGIIESVTETVEDFLNLDLTVHATDLTKYISLRYINYQQFWATYARSLSAIHWYDCNTTNQANVVSATATTTVVTYTYAPGTAVIFSVGDEVTITGLTMQTGAPYNQTNVAVTGVGTGYFTTDNQVFKRTGTSGGPLGPAGNSLGQATATFTKMKDLISSSDAKLIGYGTFTNNGAIIYEVNTGIDLANGSTENTNCYIENPTITSGLGGVEFWINGAGLALSTIIVTLQGDGTNDSFFHELSVDLNGYIHLSSGTGAPSTRHSVNGGIVNDGYWHHVGIICDESYEVKLYCDGVFYTVPISAGQGPLKTHGSIGEGVPTYIDEIIFSDAGSILTLAEEVQQRWKAGSLLQLGFPTTADNVYSGDRVAEILCIAGFGYVTGGDSTTQSEISLSCDYYINDSATAWVPGLSTNGYTYAEPYYYDSPITGSTALDLINQVCDTDIGSFYQEPDGTFSFYNQLYYGNWAWDSTTQQGTWTLNTFGGTTNANHTWTDDNSGVPYFGFTLQVVRDDADVWTTVKITPQSGTDQIFENSLAEPRWGFTTLTKSGTLHTSLNNALSTATYLGYLYKAPEPRVGLVELRAETANGIYIPAMLGAEMGDPVNFKRNPSGASTAGSINSNFVIESIQHSFMADPGQWHTSFVLDPYPLAPNTTTPFP